jgi:hypothetical protein
MEDEKTGEDLRDKGIQMALFSADRKEPGWKEKATLMLVEYLNVIGGRPFKSEDLREWAYKRGLVMPPEERAWGGVIRSAKSEGLIVSVGLTTYDAPNCHKGYTMLWKKKGIEDDKV